MTIQYDIASQLDEPTKWPKGWKKWTPLVLLKISIYLAICIILVLSFPNALFDEKTKTITFTLGALGMWRYGWWFTHAVRALIYGRIVYPKMREKGLSLIHI